ncbi:MAG: HEPN domain-containing protein [Deltaproteobacteria bacterium]|nr:HEPN domain-containing protein [Deltaproteobacteria bacterium]
MSNSQEFSYPLDWLKKANEDFRRVSRRLKEGDVEDAAFHLQQAIEKALKAILLSSKWTLKKIHDLEALLEDLVKFEPSFEKFRSLTQKVTGYYLVERYPGFEEGPAAEEVETDFQEAKALMKEIRKKVKNH